ncbi:MAG: hypothetical protein AVW05_01015 [Hadesarchaea archaeon DG-33]|nr:MAG: hypothetical protein AVW05_01015 [Hadesarchaea archaeon DG-33]
MSIIGLVALTLLLGPFGSIPFAFAQGMSTFDTAIAVSIIHATLVPVWFGFFEFIGYSMRYKNRIISRVMGYAAAKSKRFRVDIDGYIRKFERRTGQFGFALGVVGFTFLVGVSWAALCAYILNIKKKTILASIAVGAVISSIFWTFVFAGIVGALPSPLVLYLILIAVTFAFLIYKKVRERKLLQKIFRPLLRSR